MCVFVRGRGNQYFTTFLPLDYAPSMDIITYSKFIKKKHRNIKKWIKMWKMERNFLIVCSLLMSWSSATIDSISKLFLYDLNLQNMKMFFHPNRVQYSTLYSLFYVIPFIGKMRKRGLGYCDIPGDTPLRIFQHWRLSWRGRGWDKRSGFTPPGR